MKKILITGANSFLATHTMRLLDHDNYQVKAMVRQTSDISALKTLAVNYELVYGDIRNKAEVQRAMENCDVVIHIAAVTSPTASWDVCRAVNVEGTKNVLEAAREAGAKQFIFVSTANAIGNKGKEQAGEESMPFMPWLRKSPYAYTKYQSQQLVLEAARDKEMLIQVVNPTFMIGSHDNNPSSGRIILMNYNKRIRFYPPGGKNFVAVTDVAKGIVNLLGDESSHGEVFLLAGKNYSYRQFYKLLDSHSTKKGINIPIPSRLLGAVGRLLELLPVETGLNRVNARMLCTYNYYNPRKAITQINLPQTPISTAVVSSIDWFKDNDYL